MSKTVIQHYLDTNRWHLLAAQCVIIGWNQYMYIIVHVYFMENAYRFKFQT